MDSDSDEEILRAAGPIAKLTNKIKKTLIGNDEVDSDIKEQNNNESGNSLSMQEGNEVQTAGIVSAIKKSFKKKKKNEKSDTERMYEDMVQQKSAQSSQESAKTTTDPLKKEEEKVEVSSASKTEKIVYVKNFTDAFMDYEFKDNSSKYGRGLCVIFSLFTGHLEGYVFDVHHLNIFFKETLNYDVFGGERIDNRFQNLTQKELFERIDEIRSHIEREQCYDRLVVVVLTHGQKDGLLTCRDNEGVIQEQHPIIYKDEDGSTWRKYVDTKTQVEDVINRFKHDSVKSLKGIPKLFLIQACRGGEVVKSAGNSSHKKLFESDETDLTYDFSKLQFKPDSPIDADILVCYATTDEYQSMVQKNGSWFVQIILEVFEKHFEREHISDMMTVVNLAVAELRGNLKENGKPDKKVAQMPCVISTLRKRFYLYNRNRQFNTKVLLSDISDTPYRLFPKIERAETRQLPNRFHPSTAQPFTHPSTQPYTHPSINPIVNNQNRNNEQAQQSNVRYNYDNINTHQSRTQYPGFRHENATSVHSGTHHLPHIQQNAMQPRRDQSPYGQQMQQNVMQPRRDKSPYGPQTTQN